MKFSIGDLIVFQKPNMNSWEWNRSIEPYLTAVIVEESIYRCDAGKYKYYDVHAMNGRKYWGMREDRLALLAKIKD